MRKDEKIAHIRESDKETQTLSEHLFAVAKLTGTFAAKIGLEKIGCVIGLLHDLGKASAQFQAYLKSAVGILDPDCDGYIEAGQFRGRIDHSTAGAQLFYQLASSLGKKETMVGQVIALCLVSHHSGLIDSLAPDGTDSFTQRIEKDPEKTNLEEARAYYHDFIKESVDQMLQQDMVESFFEKNHTMTEKPINGQTIHNCSTHLFKLGLLIRFLFSCLIDADRLDTANYEDPGRLLLKNSGEFVPGRY